MKTQTVFLLILVVVSFPFVTSAQVNSGSNGSDGAFNPTQNVTIDMNLRPDGIYHYTSVNISSGVTVTFTPNANNTPVVWLVQGDCTIAGIISVSGQGGNAGKAGIPGPGGFRGGSGGPIGTSGFGPGGGVSSPITGANASFGTDGESVPDYSGGQIAAGQKYGNSYLLPLVGGSGGGGTTNVGSLFAGGSGGGAILIASSGVFSLDGLIVSNGGNGEYGSAGAASGGGIRLIASKISGSGEVSVLGGLGAWRGQVLTNGGSGRIRFDSPDMNFGGRVKGAHSQGFQPIIIPAAGQGTQLSIQSIGGIAIGGSPSGGLANPDVIIPPQQQNPMNVVVGCSNLPLNTLITVVVRPANGEEIVTTGRNTNGSVASSTVSIPVTMPRGGGIVYAKCVSGVNGVSATGSDSKVKNIAQTGWTTDGETFAQMEIVAGLDGRQQVAYITESGKRYSLPQD